MKWLVRLIVYPIVIIGVVAGLAALSENSWDMQPSRSAAIADSPPVMPVEKTRDIPKTDLTAPSQHYWSIHDGDEYGYEHGISEDDQRAGVLAKPLVMVSYLGEQNGEYKFSEDKGSGAKIIYACKYPCTILKTTAYFHGTVINSIRQPNVGGSIGWAIMEDAAHHQVQPVGNSKKNRKQ